MALNFSYSCRRLLWVLSSLSLLSAAQISLSPVMAQMPLTVVSSSLTPLPNNDQQLIHQQAQQRALEQRLAPFEPDVRLSTTSGDLTQKGFLEETPCFALKEIELRGNELLPYWLSLQPLANTAKGLCLGGQGISLLMSRLQNTLVDHGYVTTRVLAPPQDLKQGVLHLTLVPGKIRQITTTPSSQPNIFLSSIFPAASGGLLDLRALEQGLENLQRLPSVQVNMEIVPTDQPGESDVVVEWRQSRKWRLGLFLDDSGTRNTGRYQGGSTLYIDNPLSLSDSLYFNAGRGLSPHGGKGTHNYTGQYTLPIGYWLTRLTGSFNDYYQTIAGLNGDYRYRGQSQQLAWQLGRVVHRGSSHKTRLTGDIAIRESKNFIDDTAIDAQHRKTSRWKLALHHQHFINTATVSLEASYQQGMRWFGAIPAAEEKYGEGTALSKIAQLTADIELPFRLGNENFRYNLHYLQQFTTTALTPPDQLSIGNRWTVRGFNGERSLSANQGGVMRNEWGWFTPFANQQLYLGIDYGQLSRKNLPAQLGRHLAGGAIGLRGFALSTGYDAFIGVPLSAPNGFMQDPVTLGFTLNWHY